MSHKTFLTIHSVIYAFFALALFFTPTLLWPVYGVEINDQYALFLSQHNSIFLGGIAALGFVFRSMVDNNEVMHTLYTGLLWINALGFIITLYACITGILFGFGWSDPAFYALLTFICFMQRKKATK